MELFGHMLSDAAIAFKEKFEPLLDKPHKYRRLPGNFKNFGNMEVINGEYVIRARANVPTKSFEATVCHELYHAYQFSCGFPTVVCIDPYSPSAREYIERLRSNILDLSAEKIVTDHRLDNSHVINDRFNGLINLNHSKFNNVDEFNGHLLAVDLLLDITLFEPDKAKLILKGLKRYLPSVYDRYINHKMWIDKFGHDTPQSCFTILGNIVNDMKLWGFCRIEYGGEMIYSQPHFEKSLKSTHTL